MPPVENRRRFSRGWLNRFGWNFAHISAQWSTFLHNNFFDRLLQKKLWEQKFFAKKFNFVQIFKAFLNFIYFAIPQKTPSILNWRHLSRSGSNVLVAFSPKKYRKTKMGKSCLDDLKHLSIGNKQLLDKGSWQIFSSSGKNITLWWKNLSIGSISCNRVFFPSGFGTCLSARVTRLPKFKACAY